MSWCATRKSLQDESRTQMQRDSAVLKRITHHLLSVPWADTRPLGHFSILGDVVGTHERGTDSATYHPATWFQEQASPQSKNSSYYGYILNLSLKCPQSQNCQKWIIKTKLSSLNFKRPLHATVWEPRAATGACYLNGIDQEWRIK